MDRDPDRRRLRPHAIDTFDPDLFEWEAWRPEEVQRLLVEVDAPWCVAAGWAIDLFLGEERREHGDLEIAVAHHRFDEIVAALAAYELFVVGRAEAVAIDRAGAWFETYHQTWVLDRSAGRWRLDVFREPADGDTWICRRDESIRLPYAELIERTPDGIPYARPEIVLLFKAKHAHQQKNADDLAAVLPRLAPERRRWLGELIARVHPGHAWLEELETRAGA